MFINLIYSPGISLLIDQHLFLLDGRNWVMSNSIIAPSRDPVGDDAL